MWICLKDKKPEAIGWYLVAMPNVMKPSEWRFCVLFWEGTHFKHDPKSYFIMMDARETFWKEIEAPTYKLGK